MITDDRILHYVAGGCITSCNMPSCIPDCKLWRELYWGDIAR